MDDLVDQITIPINKLGANNEEVASSVAIIAQSISEIRSGLGTLSHSSKDNATDLNRAGSRINAVVADINRLLHLIASSGAVTADTPYINFAIAAARTFETNVEAELVTGRITTADIFNNIYTPITGSNPKQLNHSATACFETLFRPLQA